MAEHNVLGKQGEDIACNFLESKGYIILERNWKWRRLELDIITRKGNELVIIEVKTRRNNIYGEPEESINNSKINRIINAADSYIKKNKVDLNVRFDVISITGNIDNFEIKHIKNAFSIW